MKIGVLFNCQVSGLAAALTALLPHAEVTGIMLKTVLPDPAAKRAAHATLAACDHVICWDGARDELLSAAGLRDVVPHLHMLPTLQFAGYHPDMIFITLPEGGRLSGPTEHNHSRLALAGYLGGLTVDETVELYSALSFARLGYFNAFAEQTALVTEDFARHGIDAAPMLRRLSAAGCFMHSFNHPKIAALLEMARAACELMGVPVADVAASDLPDLLAANAAHPLFEDIARRLGVPAEGMFHKRVPPGGRPVPIELPDFVAASFAAFAAAPRAALLRADRVDITMSALRLTPLPAPENLLATVQAWARAQLADSAGELPRAPPDWLTSELLAAIPAEALQAQCAALLATLPPAPSDTRVLLLDTGRAAPANAKQMQAIAGRHGFVAHDTRGMAPAGLARLLAGAAAVVAPYGPAMAFLLFCAPGALVVEVPPLEGRRPIYAALCARLGLRHRLAACNARLDGRAIVNLEKFRPLLRAA